MNAQGGQQQDEQDRKLATFKADLRKECLSFSSEMQKGTAGWQGLEGLAQRLEQFHQQGDLAPAAVATAYCDLFKQYAQLVSSAVRLHWLGSCKHQLPPPSSILQRVVDNSLAQAAGDHLEPLFRTALKLADQLQDNSRGCSAVQRAMKLLQEGAWDRGCLPASVRQQLPAAVATSGFIPGQGQLEDFLSSLEGAAQAAGSRCTAPQDADSDACRADLVFICLQCLGNVSAALQQQQQQQQPGTGQRADLERLQKLGVRVLRQVLGLGEALLTAGTVASSSTNGDPSSSERLCSMLSVAACLRLRAAPLVQRLQTAALWQHTCAAVESMTQQQATQALGDCVSVGLMAAGDLGRVGGVFATRSICAFLCQLIEKAARPAQLPASATSMQVMLEGRRQALLAWCVAQIGSPQHAQVCATAAASLRSNGPFWDAINAPILQQLACVEIFLQQQMHLEAPAAGQQGGKSRNVQPSKMVPTHSSGLQQLLKDDQFASVQEAGRQLQQVAGPHAEMLSMLGPVHSCWPPQDPPLYSRVEHGTPCCSGAVLTKVPGFSTPVAMLPVGLWDTVRCLEMGASGGLVLGRLSHTGSTLLRMKQHLRQGRLPVCISATDWLACSSDEERKGLLLTPLVAAEQQLGVLHTWCGDAMGWSAQAVAELDAHRAREVKAQAEQRRIWQLERIRTPGAAK